MSYRNQDLMDVTVRLEMDDSKLKERLDEIEEKLDRDSLSNEDVATLIGDYVSENDLQTADDVQSLLDGQLESKVQDVVDGMDIVNESQMEQAIDNKLEDYVTASEVRDIISEDYNLDGENEDVTRALNQVEELTLKLADLERRFEMYATRVDDLMQNNHTLNEAVVRIEGRMGTALDFFGLIQKAFELLRRGA